MSPVRIVPPPIFELNTYMRDFGLDANFLDGVLEQVKPNEVERGLKQQKSLIPTVTVRRGAGGVGTSGTGSPPVLLDF